MLKKLFMVFHVVFCWLAAKGIYGKTFTNCECIDHDYDGCNNREWQKIKSDAHVYSTFKTDQGNLIICHGNKEGDFIVNFAIPVELFGTCNNLKGVYWVNSWYAGNDYYDDEVVIRRVNKKPYCSWNEWSKDGKTYFTYSNAIMDILANIAGIS